MIAGDNIFTDNLRGMVEFYERVRFTVIGVHQIVELALTKHYSCVLINPVDNGVVSFEEKPKKPSSSIIGTGLYIFPRFVLERLKEYFSEGRNPDSPGHFISWLIGKEPVYAYKLHGAWFDVGTPETYQAAQDHFKRVAENVASAPAS